MLLHKMNFIVRGNPINNFLRLRSKQTLAKTNPREPKLASDVVNYLSNSPEYTGLLEKIPKSLLRKIKTPENMYLVNKNTAEKIAKTLKNHLMLDNPIIEVNPGLGLLSEQLLNTFNNKIYMYETSNHFSSLLSTIQEQHPDRVIYKVADFFGMWKLAFQDKIDNGNRIKDLLGDLYTEYNNRAVYIIGSMSGLNFIKQLINNIVFNNSNKFLGKPDLYIIMPGHNYKVLTDDKIQKGKQKSLPALFQIFFDSKVITGVPKLHFLPWTHQPNLKNISVMDEYNLYLVNITQKDKLPCPPEYFPLLWYFFRPHMFHKSTRVIPMLEQWIPGCGVWLITGQDPPDTNKNISPSKDDAELPHMTIFTEFGDLNLQQKITVFKKFISWPEYMRSPFKVAMENNLPKFVSHLEDDDKDTFANHIDDMEHSDSETD